MFTHCPSVPWNDLHERISYLQCIRRIDNSICRYIFWKHCIPMVKGTFHAIAAHRPANADVGAQMRTVRVQDIHRPRSGAKDGHPTAQKIETFHLFDANLFALRDAVPTVREGGRILWRIRSRNIDLGSSPRFRTSCCRSCCFHRSRFVPVLIRQTARGERKRAKETITKSTPSNHLPQL